MGERAFSGRDLRAFIAVAGVIVTCALLLAAPASANHVLCGQTITTDTTLDADLSCTTGGAPLLTIDADDVTLDLNGFTIDGPGAGNMAISANGRSGITIESGRIEDVNLGISIGGSAGTCGGVNINNLEVATLPSSGHGETGISIGTNCDDSVVESNTVSLVGAGSFASGAQGIGIETNGERPEISRNTVTTTGTIEGIRVSSGHDGVVERNTIPGNSGADGRGINASGDRLEISRNVITHSAGIALDLTNSTELVVERNALTGTGSLATGIRAFDLVDGSISKNTMSETGTGIAITGLAAGTSLRNEISGNTISGTTTGITIGANDDLVVTKNKLSNVGNGIQLGIGVGNLNRTQVIGNQVTGGTNHGVIVLAEAKATNLAGNKVSDMDLDGIRVDANDAATILTKNKSNDNGEFGIEAAPGVTDGGKNKAKGNGGPAQCTSNIAC